MATKLKSVFYDRTNNIKITIYKRSNDGLLSIEKYNNNTGHRIVLRRHKGHAEYNFYLNMFYIGLNNKSKFKRK